ncbi:MAG TPA: pyridoxal phosphate-dependent aminotransferase family protein [Tenuifilaceae bacterium]|nr:pyridoxal phosphate-dependent aminotransferase family protein [Tenuifilaceae bacterium]HPE19171.1 pyridoxal phosphate-dependent aminotransferase family protein [Tenuifilaceae bacterium]HPJ46557.1 pyridoxal phosphate-dependent aminotransferase family protein [Tenuifilaceae bacterium]HPQ35238.1 pyridoxal phosphate-dependent aminotransferase family protein [Tenuifilaceae bacterium]HRX67464.1 pyridoxal phosphate-dependent aminotransferase family protein [Tenuifilaceae bacterium]
MDIFEKLRKNMGPIGQYQKQGHGYFAFPKLEGEINPRMMFRGKEVLTWSLNNYLGLANHPEVRKADAEGAAKYGMAYPMGARMMSGHTSLHEELEQKLAAFVGKPAAYLLNYGYQGMVSIIDSLLSRNDVVVYDSESHACIIDGLRLFPGKRFVYSHNDMDSLRKQLGHATKLAEKTGGGILVITEGVFGMAGDLGNLKAITDLKSEFNFRLLVDDAHGFGTMGKNGAGTGEHFGVQDKVDVYFATFAKSMAGIGGFVAADEDIVMYLTYNLRSQIFAKSLPMPMVIGALKRLELIQTHPDFLENLRRVSKALQDGLTKVGLDIGKTQSPVTPVYMKGSVPEATNMVLDLRENYGIFCSIVVYPVIPKGQILLRLIPTAVHTLKDVEITIKAFAECAEKLKKGEYYGEEVVQA